MSRRQRLRLEHPAWREVLYECNASSHGFYESLVIPKTSRSQTPAAHECTKRISAFGAGRFPKKSQSFAFSAFQVSSKRQLDD